MPCSCCVQWLHLSCTTCLSSTVNCRGFSTRPSVMCIMLLCLLDAPALSIGIVWLGRPFPTYICSKAHFPLQHRQCLVRAAFPNLQTFSSSTLEQHLPLQNAGSMSKKAHTAPQWKPLDVCEAILAVVFVAGGKRLSGSTSSSSSREASC